MGLASLLLGCVAIVAMIAAVIFTPVPNAGTAFACGALLFSLLGIVMGGVGISRSRYEGSTSATAIIGLVLSILTFLMSLLVAVTCGACNTLCSGAFDLPASPFDDGGMRAPHDPTSGPDAGPAQQALPPDEPPPEGPPPAFPPPAFPPPAFPPPDFPTEPTEPGGGG